MSAPSGIHFPTASLGTSFPTVSGVKLVRDTITHDVNIHSFLGGVKEGRWREPVQQIRQAFAAGGKKAANPLKEKLPAITISGRFRERNDAAIEMHSGLLCVDLGQPQRRPGCHSKKAGARPVRFRLLHISDRRRLKGDRPHRSGRGEA
jgi:hypothetical protein